MKNHQESTYALIVRSEEKGRTVLETIVFTTFILCALVAMWQFVQHPVNIPASGIEPCVACTTVGAGSHFPG